MVITISSKKRYSDKTISTETTTTTQPAHTFAGVVKSKVVKKAVTLGEVHKWKIIFLIFTLVLFVTMVYGPIAAFLVELFPTKIRYTSMSLPYHIGNGVFGGLVPFIGILIVELSKTKSNPVGHPLAGLWYPIGVAAVCFIIGAVYLSNKKPNHE
jgi:MHS family proline/betaine transporter-like MFS transporter